MAGEPTENGESYACVYVTVGSDLRLEADDWRGQSDAGKEAVAKLAAAAPALARALLAVEFGGYLRDFSRDPGAADGPCCSVCGARPNERHCSAPELRCEVDAALEGAGLPDQASRDEARRLIAAMPAR